MSNKFTLTVKIVDSSATYTNDEGKESGSWFGHVWYSISDGISEKSYGYDKRKGVNSEDDTSYHKPYYYTGTITISEDQYNKLLNFGERDGENLYGFEDNNYDGLTNSCIDFTWKALSIAGFNPKDIQGDLIPSHNADDFDETLYKLLFGNNKEWEKSSANSGNYHVIYGGKESDNINSNSDTNSVYGGDGDDIINGNFLDQKLYGGDGNDTIYGNDGMNTIVGGSGNDKLYGGKGDDFIYAGKYMKGNNEIDSSETGGVNFLDGGYGSDILFGSAADDTLIGGDDNYFDHLIGGLGYDTYYANDKDTITDSDGKGRVYLNGTQLRGGKIDENLSSGNIEIYKSNDGSIIYEYDTNSKTLKANGLTINDFDNEELEINLTKELVNEFAILSDTTGSMGGAINSVKAQAIDIVNSAFERDPNARIGVFGYNDPSVQTFTNLTNDQGAVISAINSLYADDGGDTPEMTYRGIYNAANSNWSEYSVKRIFIFGDAPAKDTDFKETALTALKPNSTKTRDAFKSNDSDLNNIQVFAIQTGGGAEVAKEFREIAEFSGGAYINLATSGYESVADILFDMMNLGTNKSETIIGNDKNNTLNGKGGDDILQGGLGSDTYEFDDNFGKDTIIETNPNNNDKNIIKFNNLTTIKDLTFTQNANDLIINHKNKQNSITIKDFYTNETKISFLEFADGSKLSNTDLKDFAYLQSNKPILHYANLNERLLNTYAKSAFFMANNDTSSNISGGLLNDALIGSDKDDNINGGYGDDILIGKKGNDILNGGKGDDKYIYHKNGGNDVIEDNGGDDTLLIKGYDKDDAKFSIKDRDLIINFNNSNDKITIKNHYRWLFGKPNQIENIIFDKDDKIAIANVDKFIQNSKIKDDFKTKIFENETLNFNKITRNLTSRFAGEKATNSNKDSNFINQTQINKIIEQLNTYANDNGLTSITHDDIASNQNLMQLVMSGWNA